MLRSACLAFMIVAGASSAFAQTPRGVGLVRDICLANARDGAQVADLATQAGAVEVRNPLWPDYKSDGYPEKAFAWADTPDTFVFVLKTSVLGMPSRCTVLLLKTQSKLAAEIVADLVLMDKTEPGGVLVIGNDHGRMVMVTDAYKQFDADVTLGASNKFGEYALVSLSRDPNYKPAPEAPAEPAPTPPAPG